MAYSTYSDIQNAVGGEIELKRISKSDPLDTTMIGEAISQADSLINLFCNGTSGYPFSTTPDFVKQLSIDLSIYNVYLRSWSFSDIPASYVDLYNKAMELLRKIASGELSLVGEPAKSINNKGYYFFDGRNVSSNNPRTTLNSVLRYL